MTVVKKYLSLIKFSHTIFAMPFALIGFTLGLQRVQIDSNSGQWSLPKLMFADDLASEHRIDFYRELLNQYRLLSDIEVTLDVKHWISDWPVTGHSDDKTIAALYR